MTQRGGPEYGTVESEVEASFPTGSMSWPTKHGRSVGTSPTSQSKEKWKKRWGCTPEHSLDDERFEGLNLRREGVKSSKRLSPRLKDFRVSGSVPRLFLARRGGEVSSSTSLQATRVNLGGAQREVEVNGASHPGQETTKKRGGGKELLFLSHVPDRTGEEARMQTAKQGRPDPYESKSQKPGTATGPSA